MGPGSGRFWVRVEVRVWVRIMVIVSVKVKISSRVRVTQNFLEQVVVKVFESRAA